MINTDIKVEFKRINDTYTAIFYVQLGDKSSIYSYEINTKSKELLAEKVKKEILLVRDFIYELEEMYNYIDLNLFESYNIQINELNFKIELCIFYEKSIHRYMIDLYIYEPKNADETIQDLVNNYNVIRFDYKGYANIEEAYKNYLNIINKFVKDIKKALNN